VEIPDEILCMKSLSTPYVLTSSIYLYTRNTQLLCLPDLQKGCR
jgi:hypothetical protein